VNDFSFSLFFLSLFLFPPFSSFLIVKLKKGQESRANKQTRGRLDVAQETLKTLAFIGGTNPRNCRAQGSAKPGIDESLPSRVVLHFPNSKIPTLQV
jgi:hypothetical protein